MRAFAFGFAADGTIGWGGEVAAALGDQNFTRQQPRDYDDDWGFWIHTGILPRPIAALTIGRGISCKPAATRSGDAEFTSLQPIRKAVGKTMRPCISFRLETALGSRLFPGPPLSVPDRAARQRDPKFDND